VGDYVESLDRSADCAMFRTTVQQLYSKYLDGLDLEASQNQNPALLRTASFERRRKILKENTLEMGLPSTNHEPKALLCRLNSFSQATSFDQQKRMRIGTTTIPQANAMGPIHLSHGTCFGCLLSSPSHVLSCGHLLCNECGREASKPFPLRQTRKSQDNESPVHCDNPEIIIKCPFAHCL